MRRKLIMAGTAFLILLILAVSVNVAAAKEEGEKREITILFTHDLHDHFLPARDEKNGEIVYTGGFARLQSAINSEKTINDNVLLVDGGDFAMGTPFQTIFRSESPELIILGQLGYDAVTFGNHEYDYRASGLADSLTAALESGEVLPKIVQANVVFTPDETGGLSGSLSALQKAYEACGVKDYTVIEKNGIRIGVFGIMGVDSASNAPMAEVTFTDPVENARRVAAILKDEEKVDLIICLSHSGTWEDHSVSEDELLAEEVPEIDVIISAHTHTELPQPIIAGNTIIGSAGDSCRNLGVISLAQDGEGWQLDDYRLRAIDDQLEDDPEIMKRVNYYKNLLDEEYFNRFNLSYDQVLAYSPFDFNTVSEMTITHAEEPLGNLIGDAYIYAVKKAEGAEYVPVDAAIVPVGTIRSTFFEGDVSVADTFSVSSLGIGPDNVPGYPLISVYLTGKELKAVCEVDASVAPMMNDAQLFVSGLSYTFNPHRLIFNKVTSVSLIDMDGVNNEIDDNKLYRVVAGLYSAQMLSVVGEKSFGLLSIVPKTGEGEPIADYETQIITGKSGGKTYELKEWLALADYLRSFNKINGLPQIPVYYSEIHGRKIVADNNSVYAILSDPNGIALAVYGVTMAVAVGIIVIAYLIYRRRKRRRLK